MSFFIAIAVIAFPHLSFLIKRMFYTKPVVAKCIEVKQHPYSLSKSPTYEITNDNKTIWINNQVYTYNPFVPMPKIGETRTIYINSKSPSKYCHPSSKYTILAYTILGLILLLFAAIH